MIVALTCCYNNYVLLQATTEQLRMAHMIDRKNEDASDVRRMVSSFIPIPIKLDKRLLVVEYSLCRPVLVGYLFLPVLLHSGLNGRLNKLIYGHIRLRSYVPRPATHLRY